MIVTIPDVEHKFSSLWFQLRTQPDFEGPVSRAMEDKTIPVMDAIELGRMNYALSGNQMRGSRLSGHDQSMYIVIFGEYGYMVLRSAGEDALEFIKSESYTFDNTFRSVTERMDELFVHAVLTGLDVSSLVQWYDTTYRRTTNRHTSANFDPLKSFEKSAAAIWPGLKTLSKLTNPEVEFEHVGS